jgi:DNA-binding beta-propeller fold protein YncE
MSTEPTQVLGTPGSGDGQFHYPEGIAHDSSGNNRIQKFSEKGTFLKASYSLLNSTNNLDRPAEVSIDPFGNIYVTDTGNNRIVKLDENLKPLTS